MRCSVAGCDVRSVLSQNRTYTYTIALKSISCQSTIIAAIESAFILCFLMISFLKIYLFEVRL